MSTIEMIASHTDGGGLHEQALEYGPDGTLTHLHAAIGKSADREHYRYPLTLIAILRNPPDWWEDYVLEGRVEGQPAAAWRTEGEDILAVRLDNSPLYAGYRVGAAETLHDVPEPPELLVQRLRESDAYPENARAELPRPAMDMGTVLMGTKISLNIAATLALCVAAVWLFEGVLA